MFKTNKGALRITDIQDVASSQDTYVAPAAHPPQHSLAHSIWLHLLPGMLIVLFAIIVGPMVISARLPLLLVPSLWVLCVLIPFELGYLLYQEKKRNGRLSLYGIVLYRKLLAVKLYVLLIPTLIVWGILAFLITQPIQPYLIKTLFFWMPVGSSRSLQPTIAEVILRQSYCSPSCCTCSPTRLRPLLKNSTFAAICCRVWLI